MSALKNSSYFSIVLAGLKLVAFVWSGSLIVAASLVDSLVDALISFVNYRTQKLAHEGPDQEHPFGHGGFEVVASLAQGGIILISGLLIVAGAISQLYVGDAMLHDGASGYFALGTMAFASFSGLGISLYLGRHLKNIKAKNERSLSIEADRAHYLSDFYTNQVGFLSLGVAILFNLSEADALGGAFGGILVLKTGLPILKQSFSDIVNQGLSPEEQKSIVQIVLPCHEQILGIHRLRSRRLGPHTFIDFHLKLPAEMVLREAHDIAELVVAKLKQDFPTMDVVIHLDPDDEPDDDIFDPAF